jgi:hypothetical protein
MGTRTGRVVALLISSIVAVACGASATNGPYAASGNPNLDPRLSGIARRHHSSCRPPVQATVEHGEGT